VRIVGSANRTFVAGAKADYHPAVKNLDAPTALAELMIAQLLESSASRVAASHAHPQARSGSRSRSRSLEAEASNAVTEAIDLPTQLPYTDAVEPFVVGQQELGILHRVESNALGNTPFVPLRLPLVTDGAPSRPLRVLCVCFAVRSSRFVSAWLESRP